jgi:hypothetical protein
VETAAKGLVECEKKVVVKSGASAILVAMHRFWCAGNWFYPAERARTQRKQILRLLQEELE